jgi:hypothetical protein
MTKKNCPLTVDFWAQAHFKHLTQIPRDAQEKHLTSVRARDFAAIIHNVIQPLLRVLDTPEAHSQHRAFEEMRSILHDVALRGDPHEFDICIDFRHRTDRRAA